MKTKAKAKFVTRDDMRFQYAGDGDLGGIVITLYEMADRMDWKWRTNAICHLNLKQVGDVVLDADGDKWKRVV